MSSAADRLAAAKEQLEASLSGLSKRDGSSPADRLAAAKDQLEAAFSGLSKRDGLSAADRLAAAKDQLEATFSSLSKRDGLSPADRLAAAKEQLEATFSGLSKRDGSSAADRLAAAKQGLEEAFTGAVASLMRRADDKKDEPLEGNPELPTSNFQKTVVPIVIGLVLLALFGVAGGIIVWRRRKVNKATESESHRRKHLDIEDDGADEDYGYELPHNKRVQNVGFGGSGAAVDTGRKRTGSLKGAEAQAESKRDEPREQNSKEFV